MAKRQMKRVTNGRSTIYQGEDGYWHGRVSVGVRDDGRPDRRHVQGLTRAIVAKKVADLEHARTEGNVLRPGQRWTVADWLQHWLDDVRPHVKTTTYDGYERAVRVHLVPGVGAHKLTELRTEHLEHLYGRMLTRVTKRGTTMRRAAVHQVHRVARKAFNDALRYGYLTNNPAAFARIPRNDEALLETEPLTVGEIKKMFAAAAATRNGARFVIALALGLRQGEVLGLQWDDVDFDNQVLTVRRARVRPRYEHGCGGTCGRKYAGYCPQRRETRPTTDTPKSLAGRRTVGLPDPLIALLRVHRTRQLSEKLQAGALWHDGGWVFSDEFGRAISPRTDWGHWKKLLQVAGVRDVRLHDARHTAATCLLLLGVSPRATMALMGWTDPAMMQRYQHLVAPLRTEVAQQLSALLWGEDVLPAARTTVPRPRS